MNVISLLTKGAAISEGWLRVALNIRTTIMVYREENYCKKCPVSHDKGVYTGTCIKENGGCGCVASAKTSQDSSGCPNGFWGNNWFKEEEFNKYLKENPIKK